MLAIVRQELALKPDMAAAENPHLLLDEDTKIQR
jgi:hypothetical protein